MMDFRKKLKIRLYTAIAFLILGIGLIIVSCIFPIDNSFIYGLGPAFAVIGIARIKHYFIITKSDERIRKQEIAESDERNISVSNKAKTLAFTLYVIIACVAVIVLEILSISQYTSIITLSVCIMLCIYWISYFIINKIS